MHTPRWRSCAPAAYLHAMEELEGASIPHMALEVAHEHSVKACRVGLRALVADGVHDLQPQITNKRGQLYTVHGKAPGLRENSWKSTYLRADLSRQ
ncbi:hypothetical protein COOONC_02989 [Cooperia oncophora]